jgi:hypothetical protein
VLGAADENDGGDCSKIGAEGACSAGSAGRTIGIGPDATFASSAASAAAIASSLNRFAAASSDSASFVGGVKFERRGPDGEKISSGPTVPRASSSSAIPKFYGRRSYFLSLTSRKPGTGTARIAN